MVTFLFFLHILVLIILQFWWHFSYCKISVLSPVQFSWRLIFVLDPPIWTRLFRSVCLTQFFLNPYLWICLFGPVYLDLSIWTHLFWTVHFNPFISTCLFGLVFFDPSFFTHLFEPSFSIFPIFHTFSTFPTFPTFSTFSTFHTFPF